jgi:hypothetical protein
MLRFCSTDGTSGGYYMSSQFLPRFITMVLLHLDLLVMIVAQLSTSFFYPSSTHVLAFSQPLLQTS